MPVHGTNEATPLGVHLYKKYLSNKIILTVNQFTYSVETSVYFSRVREPPGPTSYIIILMIKLRYFIVNVLFAVNVLITNVRRSFPPPPILG